MSRHLVTCLPEEDLSNRQLSNTSQGIFFSHVRNRGNNELSKRSSCSVNQGTKVGSAEERNRVTSTPHRVRQDSTILSPSRVGFLSALERHNISSKSATLSPSRVNLLSALRKLGIPRKSQYSPAEYTDVPKQASPEVLV